MTLIIITAAIGAALIGVFFLLAGAAWLAVTLYSLAIYLSGREA